MSADVVFLCASTIESVRLLLSSASPRHPNGLGNSSGLLGRYFMDQAPSLLFGSVPGRLGFFERDDSAPPDPFYPPAGGMYVPRCQNLEGGTTDGYKRGFAFQGAMGRFPVPPDAPAGFGMMGFGEMLPNIDNTITLDPRRTIRGGSRRPRSACR